MTKGKGMGGHHSPLSETDVWLTPPHVLAALGSFDLDPCACDEPRPWPTAARHITEAEDGLTQSWAGRVWLNPPYGPPPVVRPWLDRMAAHGDGIALIFARTETDAFHEVIWRQGDAVLFLYGRLHFHYPNGTRAKHNAGAPSVLIAFGVRNRYALRRCGLAGRYIDLAAAGRTRETQDQHEQQLLDYVLNN